MNLSSQLGISKKIPPNTLILHFLFYTIKFEEARMMLTRVSLVRRALKFWQSLGTMSFNKGT